jgi:aspartyl-tRNA(Asn)/glutamyl-tRNA(Gln) amidotransferase subunit A
MESRAFATIQELRTQLKNKKISVPELVDYFITRCEAYDPEIGALLQLFDKDSILKDIAQSGTLQGIPGIIKDNICIEGRIASCASRMLENYKAPYDATAIARLKQQGALFLGRANMDEFAMGSSTETSAFQKTKNPWNKACVPGGSSGGSAAAVAAGLAPWSLGSETGGSVRQPAAFCGIVGFKPTYGLISRYGLIAYASSLDQIGPMSRTVYDNALVLSAMTGTDPMDSSTLEVQPQDYTANLNGRLPENLTIGIVDNTIKAEGMDPEVVAAIETAITELEKLGAKIKRITMPSLDYSAAAYFILSRAEAASNLARFDGVRYGFRDKKAHTLKEMYCDTRHDGFGAEVKTRIMVGNYVLSSGHSGEFYDNAKKVQRLIRAEFVSAFKDMDLLLMPTHPAPAFQIGEFKDNMLQIDLQDYFTCPVNIAGIPAISIPCGFTSKKMPIGMQLIGPHLSESLIYQAAHAYEQVTPWHTMHPEGF